MRLWKASRSFPRKTATFIDTKARLGTVHPRFTETDLEIGTCGFYYVLCTYITIYNIHVVYIRTCNSENSRPGVVEVNGRMKSPFCELPHKLNKPYNLQLERVIPPPLDLSGPRVSDIS